MFSNYWYIIHPYSSMRYAAQAKCSINFPFGEGLDTQFTCFHHRNRFYWNSLMALAFYLLFLLIPFAYAFHRDLHSAMWRSPVGQTFNTLCYVDIVMNFFTGYKAHHGNCIVLHHGSIIRLI